MSLEAPARALLALRAETAGPLRVLLASSSSGSQGGGESYLVGLAEGLRCLGVEVESLMNTHPRMDAIAEELGRWGRVHRLPFRNTYDRRLRCAGDVLRAWFDRSLEKHFREWAPDVIHVNKQTVEDGLDLLIAAGRSGIPCVATIHVTRSMAELGTVGGRFRDRLAARILRKVPCRYIAIAGSCSRQLGSYRGGAVDAARIHTVVNGVRPAPGGDRERFRAEWGCRAGDVVLGCAARIEAQKNPLFLVNLLPSLPESVRLVWVGDGRLRPQLLEAVERAGVRDRVHWDGWRQDARARMAGFDVFVLPSLYEGLPLATLEAMAAGLPCVVSDVDGNRESVVDGETGWLCPVGDGDAWTRRLSALAGDAAMRARMGEAGLHRYRQEFTLGAMAARTAQVYRRTIEEQAKRQAKRGQEPFRGEKVPDPFSATRV